MTYTKPDLPINAVLDSLATTLEKEQVALLQAEPGAGKTTQVPLHLLQSEWLHNQRILMLEPRRLAARTAARRMASQLGEKVGETVGYRMQLDTRVSSKTRIEVVTEGVLTRLLQNDPELTGIGLVIFDEFHERSLPADLGLMLCRECRDGYRDETNPLRLLVMSATLDTGSLQQYLDAPVISCPGRAYPVTTHYLERSLPFGDRQALFQTLVQQVIDCLRSESGSLLVFLPGVAEIRKVADLLTDKLPADAEVTPLYGELSQNDQDKAIQSAPEGHRKIVLATAIAESSLTIDGIRIVIDAGLMRVPRFDPAKGMSRLETIRITADAAEQRRGRAGRQAAGSCYRLWTEAEQQQLVKQRRPEILEADLAPVMLELLSWGYSATNDADWLTPPAQAGCQQALQLLAQLGAIKSLSSERWQLTSHGSAMSQLPMHPRMAHMLLAAKQSSTLKNQQWLACQLAALLAERDIVRRSSQAPPVDIRLRLGLLEGERIPGLTADSNGIKRIRQVAKKWLQIAGNPEKRAYNNDHVACLLALGWPDRVAKRRSPESYILNSGQGAALPNDDPLSAAEFLVAPVLGGNAGQRNARVFMACEITAELLEELMPELITHQQQISWDNRRKAVQARDVSRFGSLELSSQPLPKPDAEKVCEALIQGIRQNGIQALPQQKNFRLLQQRIACLHAFDKSLPAADDPTLLENLESWLAPWLQGLSRLDQLQSVNLADCLRSLLSWEQQQLLDREVPERFSVPSGSRHTVDYSTPDAPVLQVRLQEVFGLLETPMLCGGRLPLTFELLSPARRPVQKTRDLASFWHSTYQDVKKELKGRYPKHYWPEDPFTAQATRHVRPRQ
ncbi:ATP-dependent helicase HrpB [Endozoicomonadaceae bacterium StTr2]